MPTPRVETVAAALLVLFVYAASIWTMPKGAFLTPDEGGKYLMLHAIHWQPSGLSYDLPYGGAQLDPTARFYPRGSTPPFPYPLPQPDGTLLFHWPIWFPLLSQPLYALFGTAGLYVLPLLCGWLLSVLSGWLVHRLQPGLGTVTLVVVGLATPVLFYSVSFWEHTLATLLGIAAVAFCIVRPRPGGYLAAVACVLFATLLRIEMLLFGAALVIGCLTSWAVGATADRSTAASARRSWRGKTIVIVAASVILTIGFLIVFHPHLPPRLQGFLERLPHRLGSIPERLGRIPAGLVAVLVSNWIPSYLAEWRTLASLAAGVALIAAFVRWLWLETIALWLGLGGVVAFAILLVGSEVPYRSLHGLFAIAPFCLFVPFGLRAAWRSENRAHLRLACITAVYLILGLGAELVFQVTPQGELKTGWEWGPRYLLTLYPLLTAVVLLGARDYAASHRPGWVKSVTAAFGLLAVLVAVQFENRGVTMLRSELHVLDGWDQALRQDGPVVTDLAWLPVTLADLMLTHPVYLVDSPRQLDAWVAAAASNGLNGFVFVTDTTVPDSAWGNTAVHRHGPVRYLPRLAVTPFELSPVTR